MKKVKVILLIVTAVSLSDLATAQNGFMIGPKFGLSSSQIKIDRTEANDLVLETGDNKVGLHLGVFSRITMGNLYLQPEVLWTSTGGEIDIKGDNLASQVLDYKLNKIDIPIMVGLRMGKVFRIQGGPVANFMIEDEIDGILKVDINKAVYGYQAGIGFDIGNMVLDIKYEGNLSNLGDKIGDVNVDQRNSQVLVSAGFRIF